MIQSGWKVREEFVHNCTTSWGATSEFFTHAAVFTHAAAFTSTRAITSICAFTHGCVLTIDIPVSRVDYCSADIEHLEHSE